MMCEVWCVKGVVCEGVVCGMVLLAGDNSQHTMCRIREPFSVLTKPSLSIPPPSSPIPSSSPCSTTAGHVVRSSVITAAQRRSCWLQASKLWGRGPQCMGRGLEEKMVAEVTVREM